jgi:hypothetical protein
MCLVTSTADAFARSMLRTTCISRMLNVWLLLRSSLAIRGILAKAATIQGVAFIRGDTVFSVLSGVLHVESGKPVFS